MKERTARGTAELHRRDRHAAQHLGVFGDVHALDVLPAEAATRVQTDARRPGAVEAALRDDREPRPRVRLGELGTEPDGNRRQRAGEREGVDLGGRVDAQRLARVRGVDVDAYGQKRS